MAILIKVVTSSVFVYAFGVLFQSLHCASRFEEYFTMTFENHINCDRVTSTLAPVKWHKNKKIEGSINKLPLRWSFGIYIIWSVTSFWFWLSHLICNQFLKSDLFIIYFLNFWNLIYMEGTEAYHPKIWLNMLVRLSLSACLDCNYFCVYVFALRFFFFLFSPQ